MFDNIINKIKGIPLLYIILIVIVIIIIIVVIIISVVYLIKKKHKEGYTTSLNSGTIEEKTADRPAAGSGTYRRGWCDFLDFFGSLESDGIREPGRNLYRDSRTEDGKGSDHCFVQKREDGKLPDQGAEEEGSHQEAPDYIEEGIDCSGSVAAAGG